MTISRYVGLALLSTIALPMSAPSALAQRPIYYPWCARYSGGPSGGASNCYFATWRQCMDTISGIGGVCERNGFYDIARPEERAPIPQTTPRRRH